MRTMTGLLVALLATTVAVSGGEQRKKHVATEYTHTAVFGTYVWTATPADRHQIVRGTYWLLNTPCEYWDDGYEKVIECPQLPSRREVNTKRFTYVELDGGKPLVVYGPGREGTTPCRVVLDGKQVTEVFVPVFNKKGEVAHEVEYKINEGVALAPAGKVAEK